MKAYQVLNKHGYPASDELEDMCIFSTLSLARNFIRHLYRDCGIERSDKFKIKAIEIKGAVK